jgi:hypothetical protein
MALLDLGHYTVGFVRPNMTRAEPLGSGTLVSIGRIDGILTAAHVWDDILRRRSKENLDELGLLQFPIRSKQSQRLRLKLDYVDVEMIGSSPFDDEFGPDLAFVRLPIAIANALRANSSFANFDKQIATAFASVPVGVKVHDAVVGVVAGWQNDTIDDGELIITPIEALHNVGTAKPISPSNGFDRMQFVPLPATDFKLPKSYGGTSGGGLWRALTNDENVYFEKRLMGVAFYEKQDDAGTIVVICHGPKSVYVKLAEQIRARWGGDI